MNLKEKILLVLFGLVFGNTLLSQNINNEFKQTYSIASLYNFNTSVLSITFDDADSVHFSDVVPILY